MKISSQSIEFSHLNKMFTRCKIHIAIRSQSGISAFHISQLAADGWLLHTAGTLRIVQAVHSPKCTMKTMTTCMGIRFIAATE